VKKLRLLKAVLRTWNKEVSKDVNRRIVDSLEEFQGVQYDISVNDFSEDLYGRKTEIKAEIDSILSRHELLNREESRIK